MLKATLRSAVLLGLLVWSVPSFAEVQNVKVGGDITVRSFFRKDLDLHDNDLTQDGAQFLMSTVGVNVGADLTENVSAFIRIANERDWNVTGTAAGDLDLSQAYITLKELFYSPLTLRIGQQPIVWGRGFVLGSNLIPGLIYGGGDRNASITANEFTDFTAFDAIRGTLDLSGVAGLPITVDGVYIKLNENSTALPDDVNLLGVNVGAKFDSLSSEVETYYLNKRDKSTKATGVPATDNFGSVSTIGFRGSAKPVEGAYVYGELAYQFGKRAVDPSSVLIAGDAQQAWAADLGAEFTATNVAMTPKIGGEWIFFSGKDVNGAVPGWDPIARGYFTTALREFQNPTAAAFYPPDQGCFANGATGTACTGSATNQHQLSLYGSLKPLADLTIAPRLSWFFLPVGALPDSSAGFAGTATRVAKRKNYAGMEWDTQVTYNYTDDVQFGVIYALFAPGNVYRSPTDKTAQELITSVSVKF